MSSVDDRADLKVSVIIPTYNRAHYLGEALESVCKQRLPPWEIIVVDDGSTDNTDRVIRQAPLSIRYFEQTHKGVAAARNLGLRKATGDVIAWLDSDDLWEPGFLEVVVPFLTHDGTLHGVYTDMTMIDAEGAELRTSSRVRPDEELRSALRRGGVVVTPALVARKMCYDEVGVFDTRLRVSEDADMWLRMADRFRIIGVARPLVRIRVHSTNTISDADTFCEARLKLARKHYGELPVDDGDVAGVVKAAYGRAFRSIALAYIENGRPADGWIYMSKSAALYPEILADLSTFYELACGDQPRGYRGKPSQPDIERNGAEILCWLNTFFADASPAVREARSVAFGNVYLALGMLSDQAGNWSRARNYLFKALRERPALAKSPGFLRRVLKVTFLGPELLAAVKGGNRD